MIGYQQILDEVPNKDSIPTRIITTSEGRQVANVATLEDVKIHCQPAQRAAGHCHCYFGPLMTSINSSWKYSDVNQKIPLNCKDVIAMSTD